MKEDIAVYIHSYDLYQFNRRSGKTREIFLRGSTVTVAAYACGAYINSIGQTCRRSSAHKKRKPIYFMVIF